LEAGLPLYGNEIDESITPLEANLERFVRLDKDFIGANALRQQLKDGISRRLVCLITEGKQIARHGYTILREGKNVGQVTSGTYSPTLDRNIALGYVSNQLATFGSIFQVNIRDSMIDAKVAEGPFYSRKQV
jgi:aminomethyltransferase